MDPFHVPDVRKQTADWDRGELDGIKWVTAHVGKPRFVSDTNLISANCNPHQYVPSIIGKIVTDVPHYDKNYERHAFKRWLIWVYYVKTYMQMYDFI